MSQIKALILDKDGTIFPYRLWINPIKRALEENLPLRKRKNREEIVSAFLSALSIENGVIGPQSPLFSRKRRLNGAAKLALLTIKYHLNPYRALRGFMTIKDRYFYGFKDELALYDLTAVKGTLLSAQERGMILALFSNDSPSSVKIVTDALEPVKFSYFVDSSSRIRKPNAYSIAVFGELMGLRNDEIALISDTPEDLRMGRKAGCGLVIGIEGTLSRASLSPYADCVVSSFEEISVLIND